MNKRITRLQPTISATGIRYILDNEGREIASVSSLLDGIDNKARAKEAEFVHNAICDRFNNAPELLEALEKVAAVMYHLPLFTLGNGDTQKGQRLIEEIRNVISKAKPS